MSVHASRASGANAQVNAMSDTHRALIASLANFVLGTDTVEGALRSVMDLTVEGVPGADMAGVSMLGTDLRPTTHVFTDGRALAVDQAQYLADSGPCLDAWRQSRVVHLRDVDKARGDYPTFSETALNNGVFSTLSLPLRVAGSTIGALNLYAPAIDAFSERDVVIATDVASVVATVMITTTYAEALELNLHLSRAMESRAVIEQAKGIIMATTRCSPDAAFDLLRQQSQSENRKLREIAEEIVRRHSF
jgi:GAF domain-containing protein